MQLLECKLISNPLHSSEIGNDQYERFCEKESLRQSVKEVKRKLTSLFENEQLAQLRASKRVLRRLDYLTEHDTVTLKARVACEISSGYELLLTELLYNGLFNELSTKQCAAVLSCFVGEETSKRGFKLNEEDQTLVTEVEKQYKLIQSVFQESKLDVPSAKFEPNTSLMEVCSKWVDGETFNKLWSVKRAQPSSGN